MAQTIGDSGTMEEVRTAHMRTITHLKGRVHQGYVCQLVVRLAMRESMLGCVHQIEFIPVCCCSSRGYIEPIRLLQLISQSSARLVRLRLLLLLHDKGTVLEGV